LAAYRKSFMFLIKQTKRQ